MCKGRKYQKYTIQVEFKNGNKEVVNLAGVRTDQYPNMLKTYKRIKDRYADNIDCNSVSFCGVADDGTLKALFVKEIKQTITDEKGLLNSVGDIAKEISSNMLKLKNKFFYHGEMVSMLDKKRDVLNHIIETSKRTDSDYKVKLYDEMQEISQQRRWHKSELAKLSALSKTINFTHVSNVFSHKELFTTCQYEYDKDIAKASKQYIEEKYVSEKQLKAIKKDFEHVFIDETTKIIYGYNNCKKQ